MLVLLVDAFAAFAFPAFASHVAYAAVLPSERLADVHRSVLVPGLDMTVEHGVGPHEVTVAVSFLWLMSKAHSERG